MHACPCVASHCNADPNDSGVVAAVVAVGLGFRVKLSQLSQTMFRGRLS
jgi:predicted amino acid-binding ACT domain protein